MKKICIIATPRSGSNHLCSLWKNFDNHVALSEIFHEKTAFDCGPYLSVLNSALDISASSIDDRVLTDAMRANPKKVIDTIADTVSKQGARSMSFKVFSNHLQWEDLAELMKDPEMVCVVVNRLQIDSYISSEKAKALKQWAKVDTTDTKVTLDAQEFLDWSLKRRHWYSWAEKQLVGLNKPNTTLLYEADIQCSNAEHLWKARLALSGIGVDLSCSNENAQSTHRKQDVSQNYYDKVSNWGEFCQDLRDMNKVKQLFSY